MSTLQIGGNFTFCFILVFTLSNTEWSSANVFRTKGRIHLVYTQRYFAEATQHIQILKFHVKELTTLNTLLSLSGCLKLVQTFGDTPPPIINIALFSLLELTLRL